MQGVSLWPTPSDAPSVAAAPTARSRPPCTCMCMHVCVYVRVRVRVFMYMCVCVYACTCTCVHVHARVCIHRSNDSVALALASTNPSRYRRVCTPSVHMSYGHHCTYAMDTLASTISLPPLAPTIRQSTCMYVCMCARMHAHSICMCRWRRLFARAHRQLLDRVPTSSRALPSLLNVLTHLLA